MIALRRVAPRWRCAASGRTRRWSWSTDVGSRPIPFAQNGITAFVDLNSIPLAAIQQIDILRDGASAIYGTDAIAGVVNVRFLEKFDGALVSIGYGNTTDTDTSEYRASLITGYTNESSGTELVVVADYFHREALFQVDRYFSLSIDQRRQGGSSFLSSVANPGTVFDPVTGDPLRVPADSDGTPEVGEFLPGRNRFDRAPFQPLVPETERWGFTTRAKVRLAPAVDLFAEFGYRNIFTETTARARSDRRRCGKYRGAGHQSLQPLRRRRHFPLPRDGSRTAHRRNRL